MTNKGLLISYSSIEIFKVVGMIVIMTYTINKIQFHYSMNHVISFILSIFIVLYYTNYINDTKINKYNIFDEDMIQYKYLFLDVEIISTYNNLNKYKKFNQNAFVDSLVSVNKIMKIYYNFHKRKMNSNRDSLPLIIYNQITNMELLKKQAINSLLSMIINVPVDMVENNFTSSDKYIEQQTNTLFNLITLKIRECYLIYKEKYINDTNINSYSDIYNYNVPVPNPIKYYNYLSNYDLY